METFTAIDFETAHPKRWSICQVGLVQVENGLITNEVSILVQPPDNIYWSRFIDIHGITPEMTRNAPTFAAVWPLIERYIQNRNVVAHNGFGFDFNVLAQTLEYYGLTVPDYEKFCTYRIYRDNLSSLCQKFEIKLNHHEALSDARACARLFLLHSKLTVGQDQD